MIDVHRHILPGIDDGPATIDEAVLCAKNAEGKGIKKIIATPHTDGINVTREEILASCDNLNRVLSKNNIGIQVFPGAEVKISSNTGELLRSEKLMTVNDSGNYILLELPNDKFPFYLTHVLKQIKSLGVTPIIAHPERNRIIMNNKRLWKELLDVGILTQINAGSLIGYFGEEIRKIAKKLVKNGFVNLIGSDCHGLKHNRPEIIEGINYLNKQIGSDLTHRIIYENPQKLLNGGLLECIYEKKSNFYLNPIYFIKNILN